MYQMLLFLPGMASLMVRAHTLQDATTHTTRIGVVEKRLQTFLSPSVDVHRRFTEQGRLPSVRHCISDKQPAPSLNPPA
jgi:hypothetical protein